MTSAENCKSICLIVFSIGCCVTLYCVIAGTFMLTGANKQNGIATLNGTFIGVNWCKSSCDTDFEFGTWCYQDFEVSVAWEFANETFSAYNRTVHWRSASLSCDNITANASLSVMIERDRPSVPYILEPFGSVFKSGLTMAGQAMFSTLIGLVAMSVFSAVVTFIFERICKRSNYENL